VIGEHPQPRQHESAVQRPHRERRPVAPEQLLQPLELASLSHRMTVGGSVATIWRRRLMSRSIASGGAIGTHGGLGGIERDSWEAGEPRLPRRGSTNSASRAGGSSPSRERPRDGGLPRSTRAPLPAPAPTLAPGRSTASPGSRSRSDRRGRGAACCAPTSPGPPPSVFTGSTVTRSIASPERCESRSKVRSDSMSSPHHSSRAGAAIPNPYTSRIPPRTLNCATSVTVGTRTYPIASRRWMTVREL